MVDAGKSRLTREEDAQRAAKQQKTSHLPQLGQERSDTQPPEPQAWLLAPMHGGEPLRDDASIRDFNGGIGCHIVPVPQALDPMVLIGDLVKALNLYSNPRVGNHSQVNKNSNARGASKKFWMQKTRPN